MRALFLDPFSCLSSLRNFHELAAQGHFWSIHSSRWVMNFDGCEHHFWIHVLASGIQFPDVPHFSVAVDLLAWLCHAILFNIIRACWSVRLRCALFLPCIISDRFSQQVNNRSQQKTFVFRFRLARLWRALISSIYIFCILCMYSMYVFYVCVLCMCSMYSMYVFYVCILCTYAMHVFCVWI